jgi:pimeloyl-ACP methyl ester carboxylesterase
MLFHEVVMKKLLFLLFVFASGLAYAAIPHPEKYSWGTIEVPEDYSLNSGQKLKIYWEKLKSSSSSPKAIVMINGGPGMTHESFHQATQNGFKHDWFEALRTHYDIYYFDQRGTGKSSGLTYGNLSRRNYRTYGAPDICRDIEELRKNVIRKEKIAVLGESYGGMAALTYAIMFPDAVEKLVIHDSSPSNAYFTQMHVNFSNGLAALDLVIPGVKQNMETCVTMFDNGQVSNAYGYTLSGNDFLTLCLGYTYQVKAQVIMAMMAEQIVAEGRSDILDAILAPATKLSARVPYSSLPVAILLVQTIEMLDMDGLNSAPDSSPWTKDWLIERILQPRIDFKNDLSLNYFKAYNVIDDLGTIKAPTLIVVGNSDFICPPAYAQIMHDKIADSRLFKVKNAAHGGFVEQNELVVGRIRSFLLDELPKEERVIEIEQMRTRSLDEAVKIWLEGASRLGITTDFIKNRSR